jgi:hypothetical protein
VSRELLDELLEARPTLRARRVLVGLRDGSGYGKLVPNE